MLTSLAFIFVNIDSAYSQTANGSGSASTSLTPSGSFFFISGITNGPEEPSSLCGSCSCKESDLAKQVC